MKTAVIATPDSIIGQYTEAFSHRYPNHKMEVVVAKARKGQPTTYHVVIDGDKGNLTFTGKDLQEATAAFTGHTVNPKDVVIGRYRLDHIARIV